jgi:hypothetical protein
VVGREVVVVVVGRVVTEVGREVVVVVVVGRLDDEADVLLVLVVEFEVVLTPNSFNLVLDFSWPWSAAF